MLNSQTPLIRLSDLFPHHEVFAKCEFLAASGCFKIRGAMHLLEHLQREGRQPELIVPSMGNTALGAATGAKATGFKMTGVVPTTISKAKDEKLQALGVELFNVNGGGSELLKVATKLAEERGGYFVHPHLDPLWTDGYQAIAAEILADLPACGSIVFPVGGGGLLMGLVAHLRKSPSAVKLVGCEPYNYPKYAAFNHARSSTVADGLLLENPHPAVQKVIAEESISIGLVPEEEIWAAQREIYDSQGLFIEPSSAVPLAYVKTSAASLPPPICVVLTGQNITREDHRRVAGLSP